MQARKDAANPYLLITSIRRMLGIPQDSTVIKGLPHSPNMAARSSREKAHARLDCGTHLDSEASNLDQTGHQQETIRWSSSGLTV